MKIDEKLNKTKLMLWARVGKRAPSWGAIVWWGGNKNEKVFDDISIIPSWLLLA